MAKPKLALYWAASCGGCEIAVLDTELKVLEIADFFDIVFWPCAMDFKYDDVRAMADGEITLTLFNGAIRSSENYEMAKLLRRKSQSFSAPSAPAPRTAASPGSRTSRASRRSCATSTRTPLPP